MEHKIKNPQRNIGADVVRGFACFSVVSVHFFLNTKFYDSIVSGEKMYIMTLLRSFFMICVPLFMILSGYLMRHKKVSAKYYKKIGKTFITYLLACIACILYRVVFLKEVWSVSNIILNILNYSAAPYAWYVEMYLGFFLLVPFLNILYNNIPSKSLKKILLLVLLINTALPSMINIYDFLTTGWWLQPSIATNYNKLIPAFWIGIYPLTYYFIGCYLSEYGLKIKKGLNILLILITAAILGTYSFWRSYNSIFIWGEWNTYSSLLVVILAVLVFALFTNLDYSKVPLWFQTVLKKISALSFVAYLVSWIFDNAFYPQLLARVPEVTDSLPYYIIIVPLIFVCSLALSWVLEIIQNGIDFCFNLLFCRLKKHNTANSVSDDSKSSAMSANELCNK